MNYIVLDTETSGFVSPQVRAVQIGFCQVSNGKVYNNSQINLFPAPDMVMSKQAEEIHGLSIEHLKQTGSDPRGVFLSLYNSIHDANESGSYIIGHNIINFDSKVLNIEFIRHDCGEIYFPSIKVLDTGMIYKSSHMRWRRNEGENCWDFMRKVYEQRSPLKWNLETCCKEYSIKFDQEEAHGAAYDCLKTHELFDAMYKDGTVQHVIGDLDE